MRRSNKKARGIINVKTTHGKNGLPALPCISSQVIVVFFINPMVMQSTAGGLVEVVGLSFPVTDADAREN